MRLILSSLKLLILFLYFSSSSSSSNTNTNTQEDDYDSCFRIQYKKKYQHGHGSFMTLYHIIFRLENTCNKDMIYTTNHIFSFTLIHDSTDLPGDIIYKSLILQNTDENIEFNVKNIENRLYIRPKVNIQIPNLYHLDVFLVVGVDFYSERIHEIGTYDSRLYVNNDEEEYENIDQIQDDDVNIIRSKSNPLTFLKTMFKKVNI